jgi:teichuronic acid biosynthesis glycosyltransferase TuaH
MAQFMSRDEYSIILIAGTRFGGRPPQTDWQLARAMAARRPLLYVDPPTFLHDAARRRAWHSLRPELEQVDGVHVSRPVASPGADRPGFARLADKVLAPQIRRAADRARLASPRAVLVADPFRGPLLGIPAAVRAYHIVDKVPAVPDRHPRHALARHGELVRRSDLVTAVSTKILDEQTDGAARRALLPNGGEYEHFSAAQPRPPELPPPGRVVIGYAGAVAPRVDVDMLAGLADAEPEWLIVLVGEVTAPMPRRPNILVTGPRPYEAMPAWMQRFDVGTIPLRLSEHIRSAFPLKTYEYLAAGCPVVASPMPMLRGLEPHVRLAADVPTFIAQVRTAVANRPSPESCQALARENSWTARAAQLDALVLELLGRG